MDNGQGLAIPCDPSWRVHIVRLDQSECKEANGSGLVKMSANWSLLEMIEMFERFCNYTISMK